MMDPAWVACILQQNTAMGCSLQAHGSERLDFLKLPRAYVARMSLSAFLSKKDSSRIQTKDAN